MYLKLFNDHLFYMIMTRLGLKEVTFMKNVLLF